METQTEEALEPVLVVGDLWKRYPAARAPNAAERALARLGGVDLSGFSFDLGAEEEDDEEELEGEPLDRTAPTVALAGVSLTASAGTCLGLVGPRGSGKSTLLRVIAGLTPPSAGTVAVAGRVAPALDSIVRIVPARFSVQKTLLATAAIARLPRRDVRRALPGVFARLGASELRRVPAGAVPLPRRRELLLELMLSVPADIVLVDLPIEEEGRERVAARVAERVGEGAVVVVASERLDDVEEVADRVVFLAEGAIVAPPGGGDQGQPPEEVTGGRLELVGQIGRRGPRSAGPPATPEEMEPDKNTVLLLPFLTTLLGRERVQAALEQARRTAFPTGKAGIPWPHITNAAGLDVTELQGVMVRLLEEARERRERRRLFNTWAAVTQARLLGPEGERASAVRADAPARVQVAVEAAEAEVGIQLEVVLAGENGDVVSLTQPGEFVVFAPGPHTVTIELPPGTLAETVYRATVHARTVKDGQTGTIVLPRALRFTATGVGARPETGPQPRTVETRWTVER